MIHDLASKCFTASELCKKKWWENFPDGVIHFAKKKNNRKMIKTIIIGTLLLHLWISSIVFAADPKPIHNGRYELFHLDNVPGFVQTFVLNLPKFHHERVDVFLAPHGCDSPLSIYASVDKVPTNITHDFASKNDKISKTGFLLADLNQTGVPKAEKFFITVQASDAPGNLCSAFLVAHAFHNAHLLVLENSVPQWGAFHVEHSPQKPYIHWYELDLGRHEDPEIEALFFFITSIEGQISQEHYTYNAYASHNNARPNQKNHQWASFSLTDGDAFIHINKADPHFKPHGKYYIGVVLGEMPALINSTNANPIVHYTVTAQIVRRERHPKPILLFDHQPQVAVSAHVDHRSLFSFFVDSQRVGQNVKLIPTIRTGVISIYVSSKTSFPSKDNYEYKGDGTAPMDMVFHEAGFVYVTVETYRGVISTYDLEFQRM